MPLFDYICDKCKKKYEILVKLDKLDILPKCPHCGKDLKKLMSAPMFRIN